MEDKKRNKPKRRFAGFTDDWEERKLGEVAEIVGGGTPNTNNPEYWDGDIDWYVPAEIKDQIYADGSERKITKLGLEKSSAKILPKYKTVLFTSRAGIGKMAILRRSGATNQGFQSMVLNDETNSYFVFSMSDLIKEKAERVASGSTFSEISGKLLEGLDFMFPTKLEQEKIGAYFRNLDHLITLHQRKLDKLNFMKKSYLSEMFPQEGEKKPKRRFKGFTDDWEQCKLGEVCSEIGDGLHSAPIYDENGDYYFINGNNLVNGKIEINPEETKRVSVKIFEKNDKHLDDTTVLFSINGTIGNLAYYKGERVMLGKSTAYFRAKNIDKTFLFVLLQTSYVMNNFMVSLTGTTIKNLGLESIKSTKIMMPRNEEQKSIGLYFQQIDHLITLHQRKLEKLKNIKQAYLNEMFV